MSKILLKVTAENEEMSDLIQTLLFKLGYVWYSMKYLGDTDEKLRPYNEDIPVYEIYEDGTIRLTEQLKNLDELSFEGFIDYL